MGAQFSKGFVSFEMQNYLEMSVTDIELRRSRSPDLILSREAFARALALEDVAVSSRQFSYFDPSGRGRVSAIDVWGAMAACCSDREEAKIEFAFRLADFDLDGTLNSAELALLVDGVCRGVARFKQISAPPPELIHDIVRAAMSGQPSLDLDAFSLFVKRDEACRQFLAGLERESSVDVVDLYKRQGMLLSDLADIDARLEEIEAARDTLAANIAAYRSERGGDAKGLLCTMRKLEDVPSSDEEEEEIFGDAEAAAAAKCRTVANRNTQDSLLRAKPSSTPRRLRDGAHTKISASGSLQSFDEGIDSRQSLADAAQAKLNAQLERRARRARARSNFSDLPASSLFNDIFRSCTGVRISGYGEEESKDSPADMVRITNAWETLSQDCDGRVRLDLDLFEDIFYDAVAILIEDEEAMQALDDIKHTSSGTYALNDVLDWWHARIRRKSNATAKARAVLEERVDGVLRWFKKFRQSVSHAAELVVKRVHDATSSRNDEDLKEQGVHSQGETLDCSQPTAFASASLKVGNPGQKTRATIRIAASKTSSDDTNDVGGSRDVDELQASLQRHSVTASELLALENQRQRTSQTSGREDSSDGEDLLFDQSHTASTSVTMRSVIWIDLPARDNATFETLSKLARNMEAAGETIPRDYSKNFFDRFRCDVVSIDPQNNTRGAKVGPPDEQASMLLRLQMYSATDTVEEMEATIPADSRPSALLGKISAVIRMGKDLSEMMRFSGNHHNSSTRMYGPQLEELDDPATAEPCNFRTMRRRKRHALLERARNVGRLSINELRSALETLGYTSAGASAPPQKIGQQHGQLARQRLRTTLIRNASRVTFGELSEHGVQTANRIFQRFDTPSNDGALDFVEYASLLRALDQPPPANLAEYRKLVADSQLLAAQQDGEFQGIGKKGFIAHYESRGQLAHDSSILGVGSLDDLLQANVSVNVEFDAKVASRMEKCLSICRCICSRRMSSSLLSRVSCFEFATFALRFLKCGFVEYECKRFSNLFENVPSWLSMPALMFTAHHEFRSTLANGEEGLIPDVRAALVEYFGSAWEKWYQKSESDFTSSHTSKESEVDDVTTLFCDICNQEAVKNSEDSNISTEEREARTVEAMASNPGPQAAASNHLLRRIAFLRAELNRFEIELTHGNALPRRARQLIEETQAARTRELEACERVLERCSYLALARALRSYDDARRVMQGPCFFGVGNSKASAYCETDGMLDTIDLETLLPAGMGEKSELDEGALTRLDTAGKLVRHSREKMMDEIRRLRDEAACAAESAKIAALTRERLQVDEESGLYACGAQAAHKAIVAAAHADGTPSSDRHQMEAESCWKKLMDSQMHQRSADSAVNALVLNSLAVLAAERGRTFSSQLQLKESLKRVQSARHTMSFALTDRIVADGAALAAQFAEYSRAFLCWDRERAVEVVRRTRQDLARLDEENELAKQLDEVSIGVVESGENVSEEERHQRLARRTSLTQLMGKLRGDRLANIESKLGPAPLPPTRDMYRHDALVLAYGITVSNELYILNDIGECLDLMEEEHRRKLYRTCIAMYSSLGSRSREQLGRMNIRYARLHAGDESEIGEMVKARSTTLEFILNYGVEMAGVFPPPNPDDIRDAKLAKDEAARRAREETGLAEHSAERQKLEENKKLKKLRRKLSVTTHFDQETFKLLEQVQPKRAARIRRREMRQKVLNGRGCREVKRRYAYNIDASAPESTMTGPASDERRGRIPPLEAISRAHPTVR